MLAGGTVGRRSGAAATGGLRSGAAATVGAGRSAAFGGAALGSVSSIRIEERAPCVAGCTLRPGAKNSHNVKHWIRSATLAPQARLDIA